MFGDIMLWVLLNYALLLPAYWFWIKFHTIHQTPYPTLDENELTGWTLNRETEGKISPSEQSSFFDDLIPPIQKPDGSFRIIGAVFDIWRAILLFRWTVFGLLVIGFVAYGTIENMVKYEDRIIEHNIDDSRMLYKIWTPGCNFIVDADANTVKRSVIDNNCTLSYEQIETAVKKYNKMPSLFSNTSNIVWTYIFVFIWFYVILHLVDPIEEPNYIPKFVFNRFLIGWIVISILLFPITFRDYPFNVDVRVDNIDISVSAVYLTNNRDGYYFTSPTYMGKISMSFNYATIN